MTTSTKTWTREEIDSLLREKPAAVMVAIRRLYEAQTSDEKVARDAKYLNHRGFGAFYAAKGTKLAQKRRWSEEDLADARKIALIHSKQLVELANQAEREKHQQLEKQEGVVVS